MSNTQIMDVTVIGAGAAGLMAAIFSARAGARVLVLEKTPDGGRKILISGGSRCNILPASADYSRFVTDSSPNTLKKIAKSWPLKKQIEFFEKEIGVELAEETNTGKLFPVSNSSLHVRDGLVQEAKASGATMHFGANVSAIEQTDEGWRIEMEASQAVETKKLIMATGGLSVSNTGSDGRGLSFVRRLGHAVHPTYAALTPLIADPHPFATLSGVSQVVSIEAKSGDLRAHAEGGFLFTHRGYSGPSILDISHVVVRSDEEDQPRAVVSVNWCQMTSDEWQKIMTEPGPGSVLAPIRKKMPDRLASHILKLCEISPTMKRAELRKADRVRLIEYLTQFELPWTGHAGYHKAEVTGGGIVLSEVHPKTLESRKRPGLYLCGEILDVFGPIGGYNFLWAWATGRAAGIAAGESASQSENEIQ